MIRRVRRIAAVVAAAATLLGASATVAQATAASAPTAKTIHIGSTTPTGTLATVAPSAAQASSYCTGNVIQQVDTFGYSSRLIESYNGGSICVNVWNQTGGQAWTWAVITATNGTILKSDGPGYWWQYASTGFISKPSAGTCIWFGDNNNNPQNYNGPYTAYLHCF